MLNLVRVDCPGLPVEKYTLCDLVSAIVRPKLGNVTCWVAIAKGGHFRHHLSEVPERRPGDQGYLIYSNGRALAWMGAIPDLDEEVASDCKEAWASV
jgi:hypothetical protein